MEEKEELNIQRGNTMDTNGLALSWIIDAMEGRDVSTSDIPGAFLQTYYNK